MKDNVKVYGADWCGDTTRTLKHLDRLGVEYNYINIDEDSDGEAKVVKWNQGKRRIPTLEVASETSDSIILSVPSNSDLEIELKAKGHLKK